MSDPLHDALRGLADVGLLDPRPSDSIREAAAKQIAVEALKFQRHKLLEEFRRSVGSPS